MDKLFNLVKFDKKYIFFSLIIVIFGIIFGSLFIVILNKTDKNLIIEYIQEFINNIKNNTFNYTDTFKCTLIINILLIAIMLIFGITCILSPINILILFYKSFIIGFSISGFILSFKLKGVLLSITYIFPHLILNILILSLIVAYTLKLSINLIRSTIKKKKANLNIYFQKYIYVIILFILLTMITSSYESFIAPYFLKKIILFL